MLTELNRIAIMKDAIMKEEGGVECHGQLLPTRARATAGTHALAPPPDYTRASSLTRQQIMQTHPIPPAASASETPPPQGR